MLIETFVFRELAALLMAQDGLCRHEFKDIFWMSPTQETVDSVQQQTPCVMFECDYFGASNGVGWSEGEGTIRLHILAETPEGGRISWDSHNLERDFRALNLAELVHRTVEGHGAMAYTPEGAEPLWTGGFNALQFDGREIRPLGDLVLVTLEFRAHLSGRTADDRRDLTELIEAVWNAVPSIALQTT